MWRFPVWGLANGTLDADLAPDADDIEDLAGNDLAPSPTVWSYIVDADTPVHYVSPSGGHQKPYATWGDAATNIQEAADMASAGDLVLVDDGTYTVGDEVSVTKGITVESVRGHRWTAVEGSGSNRCFYVSHLDAVIRGFTISKGAAESGGGIYLAGEGTVENCVVVSNAAVYMGGGVVCGGGGTVRNCLIVGNAVSSNAMGGSFSMSQADLAGALEIPPPPPAGGGGLACVEGGYVVNCTVAENSADFVGGGVFCANGGLIENTIIYSNSAPSGANWTNDGSGMTYSYCCTFPAAAGTGNVTNDPQFADSPGGNYRLDGTSACVDAGTNLLVCGVDLDDVPRPLDGDGDVTNTCDMGAYEFVHATADSDGDGQSDHNEVIAGTDPTSDQEYFCIKDVDFVLEGSNGCVVVWWDSVSQRFYTLRNTTNLMGAWSNVSGCVDMPGTDSTMSYTNWQPRQQEFYRVNVKGDE